jgi:hypothetical protein
LWQEIKMIATAKKCGGVEEEEKVLESIGCIFLDRQDSLPAGFGSHWVP